MTIEGLFQHQWWICLIFGRMRYIYIYIYIQHKILQLYSIIELTSHKHIIFKRLKSLSTIETQIGAQHAQNTQKKKKCIPY